VILPLRFLGDPVLRVRTEAKPDRYDKIPQLLEDLFDTMRAENGLGLAAPQVGVEARVCVVEDRALVNPRILSASSEVVEMEEGCLSIPGVFAKVVRPRTVLVEYWTPESQRIFEFEGLAARVVQHEIDHLDGRLFIDYLTQPELQAALQSR
jgi:peptide deformylase